MNGRPDQPPFNTKKGNTPPRVSKRPASNLSKCSTNYWIGRFLLGSPSRTTMIKQNYILTILALSMVRIFLYISRTPHNS